MAPVGPMHQCPCGRWMHGLEDKIELELQAVEEDLANLDVEDEDVLSEEEGGGGSRPESCRTSSITEAEVHSRFEGIRSYLYAKGRGGEYSETQYLLSKAVYSFTHETQVKRRGKERGEVQATIRDLWKGLTIFGAQPLLLCYKSTCGFWNSHVVTTSL